MKLLKLLKLWFGDVFVMLWISVEPFPFVTQCDIMYHSIHSVTVDSASHMCQTYADLRSVFQVGKLFQVIYVGTWKALATKRTCPYQDIAT